MRIVELQHLLLHRHNKQHAGEKTHTRRTLFLAVFVTDVARLTENLIVLTTGIPFELHNALRCIPETEHCEPMGLDIFVSERQVLQRGMPLLRCRTFEIPQS